MNEPLVIFIHIPKSAGSSLSQVARANYRPEELQDHESLADRAQPLADLSESQKAKLKAVIGHYYYGIHEGFPGRDVTHVTMLRDPVERVLSSYYFLKTYPGYEPVAEMTIKQFIDSYPESRNLQTLMLSGLKDRDDQGLFIPNLERAIQNLNGFRAVGLTERFEQSVAMIGRALGWSNIEYPRVNVTADKPNSSQVSADDIAYVKKANGLDISLYQRAVEIFQAQVEHG